MSLIGVQKGIFFKPNGKKLAVYLESLGPIFTKFGQLLSTRTDILDFDTAKELESLTDSCKPFDVITFKKIVESELGDSIDNIFDSFDEFSFFVTVPFLNILLNKQDKLVIGIGVLLVSIKALEYFNIVDLTIYSEQIFYSFYLILNLRIFLYHFEKF